MASSLRRARRAYQDVKVLSTDRRRPHPFLTERRHGQAQDDRDERHPDQEVADRVLAVGAGPPKEAADNHPAEYPEENDPLLVDRWRGQPHQAPHDEPDRGPGHDADGRPL